MGKRSLNGNETSCLPLLNAGFDPGSPEQNLQQTEYQLQNWAIEDQAKRELNLFIIFYVVSLTNKMKQT